MYKCCSYLTENTNTNRLMLFREIICIYCENHMKKIYEYLHSLTKCRVFYVTASGTYSYHWVKTVDKMDCVGEVCVRDVELLTGE